MQPKPRARIPHTPPSIPYAATPSSRFRRPVAAMAMRSLFVKLKDLPRRISISGFGTFVHKDNPRILDPYKYGSIEEMIQALEKKYKPYFHMTLASLWHAGRAP
ncbi:hypothetical protein PVAP13_7KG108985 [Panicum virgatum]|nr:hypothetical protein PVAP13_7KG108985 [Panicum virgatum]KAG2571635.1 hypothetical protein PVAP13_7KG108985 [Panicum virgatum]KAG2571637.1 hypothetical protein PVAP13_7KG108985 [Panicum virgatum]